MERLSPQADFSQIREQKGISLEGIAETTKIKVSWLRAIEQQRWHELPGGIYRRSYIKQYASATGVDANVIFDCCGDALYAEM